MSPELLEIKQEYKASFLVNQQKPIATIHHELRPTIVRILSNSYDAGFSDAVEIIKLNPSLLEEQV